jgi:hypothetical protein
MEYDTPDIKKKLSELKLEIAQLLRKQKCLTKQFVCYWFGRQDKVLQELVLVAIEGMIIDGELHCFDEHQTEYVYLSDVGKRLIGKCGV